MYIYLFIRAVRGIIPPVPDQDKKPTRIRSAPVTVFVTRFYPYPLPLRTQRYRGYKLHAE